ncbi:unnamed protein product [Discosporangium mesarthrocarpum]
MSLPCEPVVNQPILLRDLADFETLTFALNCTGGAIEAALVGTVVLNQTIVIGVGTSLSMIAQEVLFSGEATEAALDGQTQSRIFELASGAILYLENISIRRGSTDEDGGAISAAESSDVTLVNTVFELNEAANSGGAIFTGENYVVRIAGGSFLANSAVKGNGGALYVGSGSSLVTSGTELKENKAKEGGAIYYSGAWNVLEGHTFPTNNATFPTPRSVKVQDYELWDSHSVLGGGAVSVLSGFVEMTNCSFELNCANEKGGALNARKSMIKIWGGEFVENFGASGGAAYVSVAEFGGGVRLDGNSAIDGGGVSFPQDIHNRQILVSKQAKNQC